jgi:hypothetical protein
MPVVLVYAHCNRLKLGCVMVENLRKNLFLIDDLTAHVAGFNLPRRPWLNIHVFASLLTGWAALTSHFLGEREKNCQA